MSLLSDMNRCCILSDALFFCIHRGEEGWEVDLGLQMSTFMFSVLSMALLILLLRQKMTALPNISSPYVKYLFPCGDMVTVTTVVFN